LFEYFHAKLVRTYLSLCFHSLCVTSIPLHFPGLIRRMEAVMRAQLAHRWRIRQSSYCNVGPSIGHENEKWPKVPSGLNDAVGLREYRGRCAKERGGLWVLLIAHRHCCRPRGPERVGNNAILPSRKRW